MMMIFRCDSYSYRILSMYARMVAGVWLLSYPDDYYISGYGVRGVCCDVLVVYTLDGPTIALYYGTFILEYLYDVDANPN
jgi:hypothetical protein